MEGGRRGGRKERVRVEGRVSVRGRIIIKHKMSVCTDVCMHAVVTLPKRTITQVANTGHCDLGPVSVHLCQMNRIYCSVSVHLHTPMSNTANCVRGMQIQWYVMYHLHVDTF